MKLVDFNRSQTCLILWHSIFGDQIEPSTDIGTPDTLDMSSQRQHVYDSRKEDTLLAVESHAAIWVPICTAKGCCSVACQKLKVWKVWKRGTPGKSASWIFKDRWTRACVVCLRQPPSRAFRSRLTICNLKRPKEKQSQRMRSQPTCLWNTANQKSHIRQIRRWSMPEKSTSSPNSPRHENFWEQPVCHIVPIAV